MHPSVVTTVVPAGLGTMWVHLQSGCSLHQTSQRLGAVIKLQTVLSGPTPHHQLGMKTLSTLNGRCSGHCISIAIRRSLQMKILSPLAGIRAAVGLKARTAYENWVRCLAPSLIASPAKIPLGSRGTKSKCANSMALFLSYGLK